MLLMNGHWGTPLLIYYSYLLVLIQLYSRISMLFVYFCWTLNNMWNLLGTYTQSLKHARLSLGVVACKFCKIVCTAYGVRFFCYLFCCLWASRNCAPCQVIFKSDCLYEMDTL